MPVPVCAGGRIRQEGRRRTGKAGQACSGQAGRGQVPGAGTGASGEGRRKAEAGGGRRGRRRKREGQRSDGVVVQVDCALRSPPPAQGK